MKRHTSDEIVEKLRQAAVLAGRGQSQSEICKTLGVSVMTFHRWRKQVPIKSIATLPVMNDSGASDASNSKRASPDDVRIHDLQLENSRLRRIVTDLLLEKAKIEEAIERKSKS
jgi:transposase-like protein